MFDVRFALEEMNVAEEAAETEEKTESGAVILPNKNIRRNKEDILYHLGLSNTNALQEMFGDVKFVCMGGSPVRALRLAEKLQEKLSIRYPTGAGIATIGKTERFSLYKVRRLVARPLVSSFHRTVDQSIIESFGHVWFD